MARETGGSLHKDELVRPIKAFGHNQGTRGSLKSEKTFSMRHDQTVS